MGSVYIYICMYISVHWEALEHRSTFHDIPRQRWCRGRGGDGKRHVIRGHVRMQIGSRWHSSQVLSIRVEVVRRVDQSRGGEDSRLSRWKMDFMETWWHIWNHFFFFLPFFKRNLVCEREASLKLRMKRPFIERCYLLCLRRKQSLSFRLIELLLFRPSPSSFDRLLTVWNYILEIKLRSTVADTRTGFSLSKLWGGEGEKSRLSRIVFVTEIYRKKKNEKRISGNSFLYVEISRGEVLCEIIF